MKSFILFSIFLFFSPCITAQQWIALPSDQSIQFIARYDDVAFNGIFREFTSTISINPEDLDNSYIRSTISVTSIDTKSRDRDQALAESDWFYFANFPLATFKSNTISLIEGSHYNVTGILQIRDQEKQISFPLTWKVIDNTHAHAQAQFELDRRDFNIGSGEWAEDETIGFNINVNISIDYKPG